MNLNWLLRMARWARHPPGPRQVRMLLVVFAAIAVIVAIERLVGWPDWLTTNSAPRLRLR